MGKSKQAKVEATVKPAEPGYTLKLYVTGATPNSLRAITNIKHICETYLAGNYKLEIIDVYKNEETAVEEQLIALPMLIKVSPAPQRKLIGDLSNTQKVLDVLAIKN
jgi:circadian clock protein KaiB